MHITLQTVSITLLIQVSSMVVVATKLIDITDFQFVKNPDICKNDAVSYIFVISSAPDHFKFRQAQRETWANVKMYYPKYRFKVAYMIGALTDENKHLQEGINKESVEHNDIVQGNIVDSYNNLTYKHMMALQWTAEMCPQANFIIKADDDVYVDIFRLDVAASTRFGEAAQNILVCAHLFDQNKPYRDTSNKYYVSYEEYASDKPYPEFCSGAAIMYSKDVVLNMLEAANDVKFFKLEDVYTTSMIRRKLGLKPFIFDHRLEWNPQVVRKFIKEPNVKRGEFLFALTTTPDELYQLWKKLMKWYAEVNKLKLKQ